MQFHKTFKRLKQYDSITLRVGPHEVSSLSMTRLVKNHRSLTASIAGETMQHPAIKPGRFWQKMELVNHHHIGGEGVRRWMVWHGVSCAAFDAYRGFLWIL